jgi:hypothetical protein
MAKSSRDVEAILSGKLELESYEGGGHTFYYLSYDNHEIAKTHVSRGSRCEIDSYLLSQMAKQLLVTTTDFKAVIDCSLNAEPFKAKVIKAWRDKYGR